MSKNIKITEKQYKMLQEVSENDFSYVSDNETKPFDGYGNITADGKKDGVTPADVRLTSKKFGDMQSMQGWNRYRTYGNIYPATVREGVDITNKEDNTADDLGEVDAIDSKELEDNTLVQIPQLVKEREKLFLDTIEKANLSPKQKAIILNDLVKKLSSSSTTYQMQRNNDKTIQSNKGITRQLSKNIANND